MDDAQLRRFRALMAGFGHPLDRYTDDDIHAGIARARPAIRHGGTVDEIASEINTAARLRAAS